MYTASELMQNLKDMGIDARGTLLVHSSMKSIGEVEGGADTVLDVLSEYMKEGLLVFPTHTWRQIDAQNPVMDVRSEPSCVGVLTNYFRKRPGVIRSLHPTHSVAALGKDAAAYVCGEENARTPCFRRGCWGKLYDRHAQILFLGCTLKSNTFLHGVEEWNDIPNRLASTAEELYVVDAQGAKHLVPQYRHHGVPREVSQFYGKMEPAYARDGAIRYGTFGAAKCVLGDAVRMADITSGYLRRFGDRLFCDGTPLAQLEAEKA